MLTKGKREKKPFLGFGKEKRRGGRTRISGEKKWQGKECYEGREGGEEESSN